jgi:glycosyltransferase involved in cell wall biosynthesis
LNLLVFNLAMDASHTALGFTTQWTNALARRAKHVSVITMTVGELDLAPNVSVYSLGKERGASEPRRLIEFYRLVHKVMRERHIDACFAHMAPLFAVLFAPVAKVSGTPVLFWYAGAGSRTMRLAHSLTDRSVTATAASFTVPSEKLYVIGHGIDVDVFRPPETTAPDYDRTIVTIGRVNANKGLDEMIAAIARLRAEQGVDLRLEITGETLTEPDRHYEQELLRSIDSLGISKAIAFAGRVPFPEVPSRYRRGSIFLNLSRTDSMDKAILESMASGCVPISRNRSFRDIAEEHGFSSLVPGPGPERLADSISEVLARPPDERARLAARLREVVEREHSLDSLADKLFSHLSELAS